MGSNRNAIVLMGAAIALIGYAVMYAALSHISDTFAGGPVGIIQGLTPGFVPGQQGITGQGNISVGPPAGGLKLPPQKPGKPGGKKK